MSRHEVTNEIGRFTFGWDQPLQSFFLQVYDDRLPDPDDNPVVWFGATANTRMYEVEALRVAAGKSGLMISPETANKLQHEKDEGI